MIRRTPTTWHRLRTRLAALTVGCVAHLAAFLPVSIHAQEVADTKPLPQSDVRGSLVIVGGGVIPEPIVERFLELGGGLKTRLVVITTASSYASYPSNEWRLAYWYEQPVQAVHVLHTSDRAVADSDEFSAILDDATAVWFIGGNQLNVTNVYLGTKTEERLHALMRRGGVIGGTSAGAAIMSRVMIGGNTPDGPDLRAGFGFLPGVIIDQHFVKRNRQPRLFKALATNPGMVGVGIDEGTALVVHPAGIEVMGDSEVVLCLAGTSQTREITQRFKSGENIDLSKWSMAAAGRARWDTYSRAEKRPAPEVPQGAVVIAGRKTPKAAIEEFLAAAGGKSAPVLVVTEGDKNSEDSELLQGCFEEAGAENVRLCQAATAAELEHPDLKQALSQARGVWFVGAQERRMMDFVLQARMDRLVKDILERGGAVGGSSAGGKIHGDGVLSPADDESDPLGDIYACGLGVLPGVVIEQQVVDNASASSIAKTLHQRFPWCVGVGLQDSAAVVVRGHTMEVLGDDAVAVIGEPGDSEDASGAVEMVQAGEKYDLRERRRMDSDDITPTR
uniref:Cyanophycinase n=1 Tax=Schlesneria paludicola TaxID=360056 RepID=A0A7C2NYC9_9PLAN